MSFSRNYWSRGGTLHDECWSSFNRNNRNRGMNMNKYCNYSHSWNHSNLPEFSGRHRECINNGSGYVNCPSWAPPSKRRKFNAGTWEDSGTYFPKPSIYESAAPSTYCNSTIPSIRGNAFNAGTWGDRERYYPQPNTWESTAPSTYYNSIILPARGHAEPSTFSRNKRDHSKLEEDEPVFMSRDEIEKYSPSRKDGIDASHETHLRYSYCAFIQNLGMRLELPQTTIGTAIVLCHRFFVRRSHACHDRYLIATAALFLATKSEETPRPLNNVLRVSSEIFHKQDVTYLTYLLAVDWFEQYRERVIEAEQLILTTLNFELSVQHPYDTLTSVLGKLGLSQTVLVNLALNLVSEGNVGLHVHAVLQQCWSACVYYFRWVYTKISVLACMILLSGGLYGLHGKFYLPLKLNC